LKNTFFKQIKTILFAKTLLFCSAFFIISLISSDFAFSKEQMSKKLWGSSLSGQEAFLKSIKSHIENKNYEEAFKEARNVENSKFGKELIELVLWSKYSDPDTFKSDSKIKISFNDVSRFIIDNEYYPNLNKIINNIEDYIVSQEIPYIVTQQYFKIDKPYNLKTKIYYIKSKILYLKTASLSEEEKKRAVDEVHHLISNIWIEGDFSEDEEKEFLNDYKNYLTEADHIKRIDYLLWNDKISQANRIMEFVSVDYQRLFNAILKIKKYPKSIRKIVMAVPRDLRNNENLLYSQVRWLKAKDKISSLIKLMLKLPKNSQYPEKWWGLRHLYAREMLKVKKYDTAFNIVRYHNLPPNSSSFWEAEWTSGWIGLRFADEPKAAYQHFLNLYNNVRQPVTLARASYWLGMSAQELGNKKDAIKWYKVAAQYPIFFYGQLAIHKYRLLDPFEAKNHAILPEEPKISFFDVRSQSRLKALKTAYLLKKIGKDDEASDIFKSLISNEKDRGKIAVIMKLVNELDDIKLEVEISREAAKRNVFFIRDKFQIIKEISDDEYAPLVHAIVKQESGFAPMAVSRVGALGYMQLMPATAKLVAKDLGVRYSKRKLASDIKYNVRLGSFYIKKLIDRFEGSEMLAIASYNAGPSNAKRWINEFYDPRKEKDLDKVVDWIELITYSETRNYVQRIMENLIVYKYLMSRQNYDSVQ